MKQRDIALAFAAGGLVHADALHGRKILLAPCGMDMPAKDAPDAVDGDADQPGHMSHRQRGAHRHYKRLHQHREARALEWFDPVNYYGQTGQAGGYVSQTYILDSGLYSPGGYRWHVRIPPQAPTHGNSSWRAVYVYGRRGH